MPRTHTIWTLAVTLLLLAAPGHDSARADDAPFDELPSRVRQMLERYATDCYRVGKDVWVKDPEVWKDRELNSEPIPPIDDGKKKKKRKPEYLPESQWRGKKPAAFKPGQLIAPVGYNLRTGEYVGELHATATSGPDAEALRRQLTLAEAKEADAKARLDAAKAEGSEAKLRLLQPIYDKAHREAESLRQEVGDNVVTGRDVYALITEHNATLPDFYTVRLLHAPAISQRRPMRVNGINTVKTVQVRPAIYKHEWRLRPHAISMALGRRDNRQERVEKFDAVKIAQREAELKQAWSTGKGEARRVGAQRLMLFYAFETETPEKANRYLFDVNAPFKNGFKLARQPLDDLDEIDTMILGDWAAELVDNPNLKGFADRLRPVAVNAYQRYLKLDKSKSDTTDRIRAALKRLRD